MATNDQSNADRFLLEVLRNSKFDTSTNLNTNVQNEKANSSFSKIEKNINEKYDKVVLKHLK